MSPNRFGLLSPQSNTGSANVPIPPQLRHSVLTALVLDSIAQQNVEDKSIENIVSALLAGSSELIPDALQLLKDDFRAGHEQRDRFVYAAAATAACLGTKPSASIEAIVIRLVEDRVFVEACLTDQGRAKASLIVFSILGLITSLYRPKVKLDVFELVIDFQLWPGHKANDTVLVTQPGSQCARPFFEVLQSFGILNSSGDHATSSQHSHISNIAGRDTYLHPSYLNAGVAIKLCGLKICWVDSIMAHFDIDVSNRRLFICRNASILRIHSRSGSLLSRAYSAYQKLMDEHAGSQLDIFAHEAHATYGLFFAGRSSRSVYKSDRPLALGNGHVDSDLDLVCGSSPKIAQRILNGSTSRSVDAELVFPLMAERLLRLQRFIKSQNPQGIQALFRDQRDPYLWYTFWAVIFLGGLNLILSFFQTGFALTQTIYAVKAYNSAKARAA